LLAPSSNKVFHEEATSILTQGAVSQTGEELHRDTPGKWHWKGHRVVLADGTTALMPDTPDNQARFPQQRNQKPGIGFPITRIVVLISLGAGTILDFALGP
jgi:hypothetical protein